MQRPPSASRSYMPAVVAALFAGAMLSGCAVISVAGAAVGVAATGVGLAVDATVGAVKLTGRALGAGSDDASK